MGLKLFQVMYKLKISGLLINSLLTYRLLTLIKIKLYKKHLPL